MTDAIRLGMITPSCNTVLEPLTYAMLRDLPGVTAHFARLRVTEISLADAALHQFDVEPMLAAARLLADARVHVVAWNGTAGAWLGFDHDRAICRAITAQLGIPATTAALAIADAFAANGIRRFALVSPYTSEVQERIVGVFAGSGLQCVAEHHFGGTDGYSFAAIEEQEMIGAARRLACHSPQAIVVLCTNMAGAAVAEAVERETGALLVDSVAAVTWRCLTLTGIDGGRVMGWGRLFRSLPVDHRQSAFA